MLSVLLSSSYSLLTSILHVAFTWPWRTLESIPSFAAAQLYLLWLDVASLPSFLFALLRIFIRAGLIYGAVELGGRYIVLISPSASEWYATQRAKRGWDAPTQSQFPSGGGTWMNVPLNTDRLREGPQGGSPLESGEVDPTDGLREHLAHEIAEQVHGYLAAQQAHAKGDDVAKFRTQIVEQDDALGGLAHL
jgi:hypothetical protein